MPPRILPAVDKIRQGAQFQLDQNVAQVLSKDFREEDKVSGRDGVNALQEALDFKISLEKDTFLVDEAIYLEMLATNISDRVIGILPMITDASTEHFRIVFKDEHGNPVDNHDGETYVRFSAESPGLLMAPGERFLLVKDLLSAFGKWGDEAHRLSLYIPPGQYTLPVIYDTNQRAFVGKNKAQEDKQTVYSNTLSFGVVKPSGQEEAAHVDLLNALTAHNRRLHNPEAQIAPLHAFIQTHDSSVYQTIAYSYLYNSYTMIGNSPERKKCIEEIMNRFPESGISHNILAMERSAQIHKLADEPITLPARITQEIDLIKSDNSKANFYAQCLIEMRRMGLRTRQYMLNKGK